MNKEIGKHKQYSRRMSMNRDPEMAQILELEDKYFKTGVITILNKGKYAHDECVKVINVGR